MDPLSTLSLMMGSSWASGLNAYATIGFLGLFGKIGWLDLPDGLHPLTHPAVFGVALFLYLVEFVADKIPAFDTVWDSVNTFVRIPAGAILAYGSVGAVSPELKLGATLIGGGLAFSSHATKSSLRAMANTSPEPFSNWFLSVGEDLMVFFSLWFMFRHPYVMLAIVALFLVFFAWFLPKIWRGFRWMWRKFVALFRKDPTPLNVS
ncbi:MAG: DUF4126 domain-containing protein [Deltaproteobacteria bacterium]|nr:DUF4126 domain-containing protein [Deltaproteobacteria bacterium]